MKFPEFLLSLWNKQLDKGYPLSIPLYVGDNISPTEINKENLSPSTKLILNDLTEEVKSILKEWLSNYHPEGVYNIRVDEIGHSDILETDNTFRRIYVCYSILDGKDNLIDRYNLVPLTFPIPNSNHIIRISSNNYCYTEELVKDFRFSFKSNNGNDRFTIRYPSLKGTKGASLVIESSSDGFKFSFFSYKVRLDTLSIDDPKLPSELADIDPTFLNTVLDKLGTYPPYNQYITKGTRSLPEMIETLLKMISDKVIDGDDLAFKSVVSGYDNLREVLKGDLRYIFRVTSASNRRKLSCISLKTVLKELRELKAIFYMEDTNPLSTISSLNRLNLVGHHGPNRTNLDMREYLPSYKSLIDPLETPESSSLGLLIHRSIGSTYDSSGILSYTNIPDPRATFNFPALTIPFIHHNDSIRCSMACSHLKQAVPLMDNEVPHVSTGIDRTLPEVLDTTEYLSNSRVLDKRTLHQFKDGYLTLGREVMVCWMPYKGLNYEDSIIISESLRDKLVTMKGYSISYSRSSKLILAETRLNRGDRVLANDIILRYRDQPKGNSLTEALMNIDKFVRIPKDSEVINVVLTKDGMDSDWESATDVRIELSSPHRIEVGDKISFSSAGKGIVSSILPDDKMPRTEDGVVMELIYNTLGVPSRMNLSQLLEGSLSYLNQLIRDKILVPNLDKSLTEKRSLLLDTLGKMNSVLNLDHLTMFTNWISDLSETDLDTVYSSLATRFVFEVKQFDKSVGFDSISKLFKVLELDKYYNPDTGTRLYMPELEKLTKFPVFYGMMRILVLKHIVSEKMSAISLPHLSDVREKSQKLGEMEMLALEAHKSVNFINEMTRIRSSYSISKILNNLLHGEDLLTLSRYTKSSSFHRLKGILRAMGIKIS